MHKSMTSRSAATFLLFGLLGLATAMQPLSAQTVAPTLPKPAEPSTTAVNKAMTDRLPFSDRRAFDDANRGFVAALPDALVTGTGPAPVWSMKPYGFLSATTVPDSVNPSLWRQAQLNAIHGLFKVSESQYQVRGMDLANMSIIEGRTGLILIDPLLTAETARAALDLYYQNRPRKPVVAVIYTHSHADHFGGVKGVVSEEDVSTGKVRIFAPEGFMENAVAENIIAGNAMSRRAMYQFGSLLPPGERGHVDTGLGKALARGTLTLIAPTDLITPKNLKQTIDGVDIEFYLAPGSEAPSEMIMYFPHDKVLNMAEVTSQNMHNIYTLRGAEVRDANAWSRYIAQALDQFGGRADVLVGQHHWPVWGGARIKDFLSTQRDLYKFMHDQTVRLLNQGYLPGDIAETLTLPASLENTWAARGYYGTLRHNTRAVYQKYLGWYDANPAHLNPLPPEAAARKAIDYMGGAAAVIERARGDFAKGEFRWVADVMSQLVSADPANQPARELGADALEQLGYQSEAGTWRGAYLMGAQELRRGVPKIAARTSLTADTLKAVSTDLFFDFLGVRLNGQRAEGKRMVLNWNFTDAKQKYLVNLENSALTYLPERQAAQPDAAITLTRTALDAVLLGQTTFPAAIASGQIKVEGDPRKLGELLGLFDTFTPDFAIVEPRR